MSLFIPILSSPFTSLPLWRDLRCDCDKHLSFSISIISLLSVALAYTRSVSFTFLFFFFFPFPARCRLLTRPSIVVSFFLQLSFSLHFKMIVIDISKRNPIAHMTFKNKVFALKQDIHTCLKTFHSQHFPSAWSRWSYRFAHLSAGSQGKVWSVEVWTDDIYEVWTQTL